MAKKVWGNACQRQGIRPANAFPDSTGISGGSDTSAIAPPQRGRSMKRCFSFVPQMAVAAVLSAVLSGCGAINATPVNEIKTSPANFDGKEVMLHGVVK